MTDSGFLRGSRAMVGLGIREVPDQLYSRCRVQVTGLDPFFGQPPLRETVTPRNSPFIDGAFSVRGNPASTHVWNDDGIGIRCSYDMQADGLNFYHHELRFFPVVTLNSPEPLSVDGWLDEWVSPLVWLTTLATGQVQEATYVGLKSTSGVTSSQGATEVTAQVFGPWISQAPYASTGRRVDELGRPLESVISLAESSLSLPSLIRQSKAIEATSNPFPELYRLALIPDLPERARFLYLLQAFEGLHGFENDAQDEADAETHRARRSAILNGLAGALEREDIQYVRETWPSRPPSNLARVLAKLNVALPAAAASAVESLRTTELARAYPSETSVYEMLRLIRNDLAHGRRSYSDSVLVPWNRLLDRLARAHMLRLLRCPQSMVEDALVATD